MDSGCYSVRMAKETPGFDDLRSTKGLPAERENVMAQKIKHDDITLDHNKSTDLLFVDLQHPHAGAKIATIEVGEVIGFPGQILARVDCETGILYGLTIQNASSFKRRLLWRYRMGSAKRAIALVVASIRAGLCIEKHHPDHVHAHAS